MAFRCGGEKSGVAVSRMEGEEVASPQREEDEENA
jgi:hypothetical protein